MSIRLLIPLVVAWRLIDCTDRQQLSSIGRVVRSTGTHFTTTTSCAFRHSAVHWQRTGNYPRRVFASVCWCVCLVSPHVISRIDDAGIAKRDTEMFHDQSWEPIYFAVKRSKVKVTNYKNIADVGLCTLESWLLLVLLIAMWWSCSECKFNFRIHSN